MKNTFLVILVLLVAGTAQTFAQGCVAIRGNSSCSTNLGNVGINTHKGDLLLSAGYRYFKSFRHFRGAEEETHRIEEGTQVINHSSFIDLGVTYGITDRLFAAAVLPYVIHKRSSMYEHGGNPPNGLGDRRTTSSHGLTDVRLNVGYWLADPMKHKFNYAVSLGVKLPTGKYDYTDTFYNQGPDRNEEVITVVDQSIQPGDGGTGISVGLDGFHPIGSKFGLSLNSFYMFNPKETNGVLTRNGNSEFSCPDQYGVRLGMNYSAFSRANFYLGARLEGVPATDAIGGSAGYRRPGYAASVEPGLTYVVDNFIFNASLPIAVYRNRTQSYEDKVRSEETGVYRHGDAAFADVLFNFNVVYRIAGSHDM